MNERFERKQERDLKPNTIDLTTMSEMEHKLVGISYTAITAEQNNTQNSQLNKISRSIHS